MGYFNSLIMISGKPLSSNLNIGLGIFSPTNVISFSSLYFSISDFDLKIKKIFKLIVKIF